MNSDLELVIELGQTIAEELIKKGIDLQMSCQSGVCGTYITKVVAGKPDHRDLVMVH